MCMLSFLSLALSFLYLSIIQHFHDLHYTTMGHTGTYYHWLVDYGWFHRITVHKLQSTVCCMQ